MGAFRPISNPTVMLGNSNLQVNFESGGNKGMVLRQSLRFKLIDMFACLFRRQKNVSQDGFEEQEIELIKGCKNGNSKGSKNLRDKGEFRDSSEFLNYGEDDQMEIEGFEKSCGKTIVTWTFICLSLGLVRLIFHWWPQLMLYATHRRCSLSKAEKILALEHYQKKYKRYHVKPVFNLTAELFRTTKFFGTTSLHSQDQSNESCNTWDQRLEKELQSFDSSKLTIPSSDGSVREVASTRVFTCKKLRYIWNEELGKFTKLEGFDQALTNNLHKSTGLSIFEQCQRRIIYGNNEIKVHVQGIVKLLFLEVLNPFYVFQIFSVTLWLSDNYIYFAIGIILMSVFGITSTIYQTRQNQKKLKTTVQSSDVVLVKRGEEIYESIPTEHLVPGDVIVIPPHGCIMHCDAALLIGNCIVNESLLTGESVPVTKIPLPNRSDVAYNIREHDRNTLFCGTQVMQTRYYGHARVLAVVLRSGFLTAKGSLVRSIMYPPPVDYKFEKDSYKFVAVLACIAGVGFIYSIFTKISHGETLRNIIVDSLDLITIVVPPALPAAMTVGRFYAQRRLQKKGIYCISPRAINVSGSIDCVCFDKTGTLTEEGLDLWGAVPTSQREISGKNGVKVKINCGFENPVREADHLSQASLMIGMAACHSLTRIDDNLIGDPLDLKMFEWTGWSLEEPGCADNEKFDKMAPTIVRPPPKESKKSASETQEVNVVEDIGIVRQFPFSSSLQRMSVITRTLGAPDFELYCKGSPEMITSLSQPQSVPDDFSTTLERYTQQGYRVIALAHKNLPGLNYAKAQRVFREDVETGLTFLGLIVLENRLKHESTGVMRILKNASIRSIMVTGDNMLTAISVARECGMLERSDKVIVLGAENVNEGSFPRLQYTLANKMCPMDLEVSPGSPVISILSETGSGLELCNNVETPSNRYHFAVTGQAFSVIRTYYPELVPKLLVRGTVFARMSPEQKQQLVELLQGLGYFVGMCGDGANDCGALKAAHAGISLSDTESSVASPFTSNEANITCVPHLIREGRGALVTSFGIFKYMAVYSLTQFVSVIILYNISSNLTDRQFLYIDLFLISVFALFFGHAEPYPGPLVKQPPSASLVSAPPIVSILCHMAAIVGAQVISFIYVQQQPWYKSFNPSEENLACYENYVLFSVSAFQYIIMAIVFSRGKPYRKSVVTNPGLITSLIVLTLLTLYIVLWPCSGLISILELAVPPKFTFRLILVGIAAVNFIAAFIIEFFIVNLISTRQCRTCAVYSQKRPKFDMKKAYLQIEYDLAQRSDWPPISSYSATNDKSFVVPDDCSTINEILPRKMNNTMEKGMPVGITSRHTRALSIPIPINEFQRDSDDPKNKIRHSSAVEQKNLRNQMFS